MKAPETFKEYFAADKAFQAVKKEGTVKIKDNSVTLKATDKAYAVADMGTRPAELLLECDVRLDENGETELTFELPENVTRVDTEVWNYLNGSEKLDKSAVKLTEAWF